MLHVSDLSPYLTNLQSVSANEFLSRIEWM